MYGYLDEDELMHYGVLGMKWGVRRYQNKDGSLTSAGKKKSRLERAYEHQKKDAEKLRKHGYHKEADAVLQVANKTKSKIDAKKEKREKKYNKRIERINSTRKKNEQYLNTENKKINKKYYANSRISKRKKALVKARYDRTEILNKWGIEANKAKLNKEHKNSAEYKEAKKALKKDFTRSMLLGEEGATRLYQLENMGVKHPKARAIGEQTVAGLAIGAIPIALVIAQSRRM